MHKRQTLSAQMSGLAASRAGVLTRTDLLADGMSRHAITRLAESWTTVAAGIYATDPAEDPWLTTLWAGLLHAGPGSAAYGETAAALHDLAPRRLPVHVLASRHTPALVAGVVLHRDSLGRRTSGQHPPRVTLDDAVIDACATGSDLDAIALISRTLHERRTTPDRLRAALGARNRHSRRRLLTMLLAEKGVDSPLEHVHLTRVERAHRLPPMLRQFPVPESGHHADGAYPDLRLLIELDGAHFHDRDADRALDLDHSSAGYRTMRFEWEDCWALPCLTARRQARAIGLADVPRRCPRCP